MLPSTLGSPWPKIPNIITAAVAIKNKFDHKTYRYLSNRAKLSSAFKLLKFSDEASVTCKLGGASGREMF